MSDDPTALGSIIDPYHDSLYDAIREGDAASIESLLTGDVIVMPANEVTLKAPPQVREWFEDYFRQFKIESLTEIDRSVTVSDKWAFEWGSHAITIRAIPDGNPIEDQTRFLNVWQHLPNRRWKLSRMMWNSARPIGAALNRLLATMGRRAGGPALDQPK